MTDRTYLVREIKIALEQRGVNLLGPCGAFQITGRVAWALRTDGVGLVAKNPGQNACPGPDGQLYAVDAVMLRDGQCFDILINSETENIPAWQVTGSQPPTAWRAPFDPDAGMVTPLPEVEPPPDVAPEPTTQEDIFAIAAALRDLGDQIRGLRSDLQTLNQAVAQEPQVQLDALEMVAAALTDLRITGLVGTATGSIYGRPTITLRLPPPKES